MAGRAVYKKISRRIGAKAAKNVLYGDAGVTTQQIEIAKKFLSTKNKMKIAMKLSNGEIILDKKTYEKLKPYAIKHKGSALETLKDMSADIYSKGLIN